MKPITTMLVVAAVLSCVTQHSQAEDGSHRAATSQLPPALLALGADASDVVSNTEADAIRGQWVLTLNLPLFATAIEGTGKLDLNVVTLSGGRNAGSPIWIGLRIGH